MADNKRKNSSKLLLMAMGGIVGAVAGFLMMKYLGNSDSNASGGEKLLNAFVILISLTVTYFLGIIIHEKGHLVLGLLTGYKFVSFRIGSYILVRQNGKFAIRRFAVAGTAGQCLMTHDIVEKDEDIPYFWYNFGGVLFNLVSAALLGLVYLNSSSRLLATYSVIVMFVYLYLGIMNILPLKKFGLANDGSNILECYRDPGVRRLILNVLIINAEQSQGKTLDSMPDELFEIRDGDDSISAVSIKLFRAARELERGNYESAKAIYREILEKKDLVELLVKETQCELMFCCIMTGEPAKVIDELYDDELQKYIQRSAKFLLSRQRLMYAYYYIYKQDKVNADKVYNLALDMAKQNYNLGDAKAEMGIIEHIKENY